MNLKEEQWIEEATAYLGEIYTLMYDISELLLKQDSEKEYEMIHLYFNEWLKILDGIGLLFSARRIKVSLILIRTLFEISLQLKYLLKDKSLVVEKVFFSKVVLNYKMYLENKKLMKNKQNEKSSPEDIEEGKRKLSNFESYFNDNSERKKIYIFLKNTRRKYIRIFNGLSWISLYEYYKDRYQKEIGISNKELCIMLELKLDNGTLLYDAIYSNLSLNVHGADVINNENYNSIRNGMLAIDVVDEMFKKIILDCIVNNTMNFTNYLKNNANLGERIKKTRSDCAKLREHWNKARI
nr:MAG TPA: hypothetical protein [Caudoviricetes sp.]